MASVKVTGINEVIKALKGIPIDVKNNIENELNQTGLAIVNEAIPNTPIDVGNLRNSSYVVTRNKVEHGSNPGFRDREDAKVKIAQRLGNEHQQAVSEAKGYAASISRFIRAIIGYSAFYAKEVHEIKKAYTVGGIYYLRNAFMGNVSNLRDKMINAINKEIFKYKK